MSDIDIEQLAQTLLNDPNINSHTDEPNIDDSIAIIQSILNEKSENDNGDNQINHDEESENDNGDNQINHDEESENNNDDEESEDEGNFDDHFNFEESGDEELTNINREFHEGDEALLQYQEDIGMGSYVEIPCPQETPLEALINSIRYRHQFVRIGSGDEFCFQGGGFVYNRAYS